MVRVNFFNAAHYTVFRAELKPKTKYGQLPILSIDGGEPIAQSHAMLRYAGRQGDGSLYPVDAEAMLAIEEVLGLAGDFDRAWLPCHGIANYSEKFGYPADFAKTDEGKERIRALRTAFLTNTLPTLLGYYTHHLEKTGAFFCGAQPTIADCYILPQLRLFQRGIIDHVPTDCLDGYPVITAWIQRMMELPQLREWYSKK